MKRDDGGEETSSFPELLNFTCRIETLISQLLLLSSSIPPHFLDPRYDPILFDLRYFDSPSDSEAKIDGNKKLEELEDQLRESCSEYMQRFFLLVDGIVVYHQQLINYLQEGNDNQVLNAALEDELGRQLLTESLALFGCLLLLMEHHMSGYLREKLLVAYLRHKRCFSVGNLEAICLLCRVHTASASCQFGSAMVSVQNPEELFIRFDFPKQVAGRLINCLKYCDLYNRVRYYPDSEHRSVALASQAGYMYVMLFYSVEILHDGVAMGEIVDRFFKDSLVVPICMHFTVDLSLSWDGYKGAKSAISSFLLPSYIGDQCQLHYVKIEVHFLQTLNNINIIWSKMRYKAVIQGLKKMNFNLMKSEQHLRNISSFFCQMRYKAVTEDLRKPNLNLMKSEEHLGKIKQISSDYIEYSKNSYHNHATLMGVLMSLISSISVIKNELKNLPFLPWKEFVYSEEYDGF